MSESISALPYWRLSSFYFFYFCVVGAMTPYWGVYLTELGYSAKEVGVIGAIILAMRMVAPNFWGWWADKTQQRLSIIRVSSFIACVLFAGIFIDQKFIWLTLVVSAYTFFWHAVLPQFEAVTLDFLGKDYRRYSQIRLWGSVGFIVAVVILGWLFDYISVRHLPVFILIFLFLIGCASLTLTSNLRSVSNESKSGFLILLRQPVVLCFLAASFLIQFGHGVYYTFYSLYLIGNHGYSNTATGLLWALGVVAEIIVFIIMHRLMHRFSLRYLMLWAVLLTSLRWFLIALLADHLVVLIFAQLLHAFSFGMVHAVSIELMRIYFGGRHQGQAQALYTSLSYGAGGALGALIGGICWDYSAILTFVLSGIAALLAYAITYFGVFPPVHSDRSNA